MTIFDHWRQLNKLSFINDLKSYKIIRSSMKLYFLSILLITFSLLSCANTTKVKRDSPHPDHTKRINGYGKNRSGTITLHSGPVKVTWLHLAGDSLAFTDSPAATPTTVPLHEVEKIAFKDHWVGLAYGLLLGAGFGTLVGVAFIGGDTDEYTYLAGSTGGEMPGLAILGGMIAGGAIGGIAGYSIGSKIQFVFVPKKPG